MCLKLNRFMFENKSSKYMIYIKGILLNICVALFFFSCNTVKHKVIRNEKHTIKISDEIFNKNRNVFIVSHSIANYSYIFSYLNNNEVEWYKLVNGKIDNIQKLTTSMNFFDFKEVDFNDYVECEAWDYSYLGMKFYSDDELIDYTFSIDPNCFIESKSKNIFLKNIKIDIENYKKVDNSLYH